MGGETGTLPPMSNAFEATGWVGRMGHSLDVSDIPGTSAAEWKTKRTFPTRPRNIMDASDIRAISARVPGYVARPTPCWRPFTHQYVNTLDIADIPGAQSTTAVPRKPMPNPSRAALYAGDIIYPKERAGTLQAIDSIFGRLYAESQPAYRFGRTARRTVLKKPLTLEM